MKYLLKSTYPCVIKSKTQICELDESDTLEIEDEQILFVYPLCSGHLPFCIDMTYESEFYSIVKADDKNIIILEKSKQISITSKEKLNFSGKICTICINEKILSFETENCKFEVAHKNENHKVFKHKNFACVQFDDELFALNIKNNKLVHFSGDEIKLNEDNLSLSKTFSDSLSRKKEAKYKLDDDISSLSETFSYNDAKNTEKLLPFRFLESIKAKDFGYAQSLLTESLKETASTDNLKSFFGDLKQFLPLGTKEFITISATEKNYATFETKNDKISDISIDKL